MKTPNPIRRSSKSGFTLIEISAVILIIAILTALLVSNLWGANKSTKINLTQSLSTQLSNTTNQYENKTNNYPPSTFTSDESANEGVNVGIEAFVAALFSNNYEAFGALTDDQLMNTDDDKAAKPVSDLGRGLFEAVDG